MKNKIWATILFLGTALIVAFISNYVADFYEQQGEKVPRSVYYIAISISFVALGSAYFKFSDAFSKDKKTEGKRKKVIKK